MKIPDSLALGWLAATGVGTFLLFGFDKWRARRGGRRVPELWLVLLGAIGGWPGGLMAMWLFRHKTIKWTFHLQYALALVPFAAGLYVWLHGR